MLLQEIETNYLHLYGYELVEVAELYGPSDIRLYTSLSLFTRAFIAILSSPRVQMYAGLLVFAMLVVALCALLATLAYLLSLTASQDTEKRSEYECGFAPFDSATRHPFEVHFYVVGILFLIFDVEIALLFPWVLTVEATGAFSYVMMSQFIYILAIGFHYEWKRGALIWPARYAPSRLTLAHAKWISILVLVVACELPPEALLTVLVKNPNHPHRHRSRWRTRRRNQRWSRRLYNFLFNRTPEEQSPTYGPYPESWYRGTAPRPEDPIYGPHLEGSCYYEVWAAAEQPYIGPSPRGPHLENDYYSKRLRTMSDQYYSTLCIPAARGIYQARWWRSTYWKRVSVSNGRIDPMFFQIATASCWGSFVFITTLLITVATALTVLTFIEYTIFTDLEVEKRQCVELWSKVNAYLSARVPYFAQLPPPARAIPNVLLMVPCALFNAARAEALQLILATLIVVRVIFKVFFSRFAARFRAKVLTAEHVQARSWNLAHNAWINRPPTKHPDAGYTDDSDEDHLRTPLFWLAVPSSEEYYSALSTGATYGFDLVTYLLPELTLLAMIVYLLKVIGVELGQGRAKKALALECLDAAQDGFVLIVNLFVLQLFYTSPAADPVLGGYFLSSWGVILAKFFVAVSSLFVLFASGGYMRHHRRHLLEYPIMLLLAILLLLCLVGANNLMSLFFAIGGFSITLYVLVLFDVSTRVSREAAMKYFYLSTISAGFIIFGTFLFYFSTGTAMFSELRWIFLTVVRLDLNIASVALLFILLGLFFKLSAFPAHIWAVEVYEGSPAPVLAFFLLPVKVAVLITFARLLNTAFIGLSNYWLPCVAIACAGSLLWGAFAALYERKISRFLGYASINQLGYLLMGIACDTDEALRSMYGYLIPYIMMSGGFLFIYIHTRRRGTLSMLYISDFRGFAVQERVLSWSLTVFLFSSVGIPPLVGFHAKYIVLVSAMQKELFFLAATGIGVGLLSAYYYLQFVASFQFEERNRIVPTRTMLSQEGRTAVALVEACLWISPALSPQLLPVFAVAADALVTSSV